MSSHYSRDETELIPPSFLGDGRDDAYMSGMKIFVSLLVALLAAPIFAQTSLDRLAEGELPSLMAIYKDLHAHPELSTREDHTSALLAKELRAAGCEVDRKSVV